MGDVTAILSAIEGGDRLATEKLLPAVYDELRKLASLRMAQERPGQTLDATALVHEAYLRLVKHGGERQRVAGDDVAQKDVDEDQVLALDAALTRLAAEDRLAAQIVEMHHFCGVSHEIVAESLGLTVYRVRQKWTFAKAWLRDDLER
jgi:hypothetical protein